MGLLGGEQVGRLVITETCEVATDDAMDRAGDLIEQPDDVVVPRWWQRMKPNGATTIRRSSTHFVTRSKESNAHAQELRRVVSAGPHRTKR